MNILQIVLIMTISFIYLTGSILFMYLIIKKAENRSKYNSRLDNLTFEQLFEIVNVIISNEISLYERNIFDNGGKILDKSTYDTYYKDIFKNVLDALSDELVSNITKYLKKDSFYSMISREIMVYLNGKVL